VLPKELKSNAVKRYIKGDTLDITKKTEADKGAREVEIAQEFKGSIQMAFK